MYRDLFHVLSLIYLCAVCTYCIYRIENSVILSARDLGDGDWLIDWSAEKDVYLSAVNKLMHVRAVIWESDWSLWFRSVHNIVVA